jgi:NADH dehydrogenase FAD-containing subunit
VPADHPAQQGGSSWSRRLTSSERTHLLLVGAGHAHLHLIDRAETLRRARFDVTLVAPREFHYSGLATAVATGAMPAGAATIDVTSLAARRGVHHVEGRAAGCDPVRRIVTLEGGDSVGYDVVSINVGSIAATGTLEIAPGVSAVKPFDRLFAFATWLARTRADRRYHISIVGGGPTGLELATAQARHRCQVAREVPMSGVPSREATWRTTRTPDRPTGRSKRSPGGRRRLERA